MIRPYLALLREERSVLLFGIGCAFLSSPGQTFFISLFLGEISSSLGLTAAQLGSLYLFATLSSASLLPMTGHWVDRMDLRHYSIAVMIGLAAACAVMSVVSGPWSLFIAFMLLRLTGQGLMTHLAVTSIARYFTARRGRALSLVAMGYPLAEAVAPSIAVALIAAWGWRSGYLIIGGAVLAVAAPILLQLVWKKTSFTRAPALEDGAARVRILDGLRIVIGTRFFWCALPILLFMPFTSTALVFHLNVIAMERGWSQTLIAIGFVCFAAGDALGLFVAGPMVDRVGARNLLSFMNLPLLLGIACLGLFEGNWALLAFLGLMGASSGVVQTTVSAAWAEVYGVNRVGTIRSFVIMLTVGGTALGPALVGLMLDSMPIASICSMLIAAGLAAAALAAAEARQGRPA
ncbi:MFS family permease [Rhodoligotrophos appendicifer]|uniref:MFS transporter n=1 Tax=Rhodoligotrophos appendicifer TaxID=987056 RepID=UPI001186DEFA|nr:MFS transporter [Rhodoligotrophos appendicifer]